jgi:hypothetical protein
MRDDNGAARAHDLLGDWRVAALLYGFPPAAIVVSGALPLTNAGRAAVWVLACMTMGGACAANALRCGRIHCYFTAPFFFAIALAAIVLGAGMLPLGPDGWNLLGLILLIGAILLIVAPERVLGRYRLVLRGQSG